MSVVMAMKEDEWTEELQKMGYQLGKFIYLCDAYEDAEEDIKAGRYNVFCTHVDQPGFDAYCESILNAMMADCVRIFERLPIVEEAQLLRNILYSGVWKRKMTLPADMVTMRAATAMTEMRRTAGRVRMAISVILADSGGMALLATGIIRADKAGRIPQMTRIAII